MTRIPSAAARRFRAEAANRILLTDGAFGTMIQSYKLSEEDYRGQYADLTHDQKGNNDLLVLTQPGIIREITEAYLSAGSDMFSPNTFTRTPFREPVKAPDILFAR